MIQMFYSFETDYARAVTRWNSESEDVRLDGLTRWMTGSAAANMWYVGLPLPVMPVLTLENNDVAAPVCKQQRVSKHRVSPHTCVSVSVH